MIPRFGDQQLAERNFPGKLMGPTSRISGPQIRLDEHRGQMVHVPSGERRLSQDGQLPPPSYDDHAHVGPAAGAVAAAVAHADLPPPYPAPDYDAPPRHALPANPVPEQRPPAYVSPAQATLNERAAVIRVAITHLEARDFKAVKFIGRSGAFQTHVEAILASVRDQLPQNSAFSISDLQLELVQLLAAAVVRKARSQGLALPNIKEQMFGHLGARYRSLQHSFRTGILSMGDGH